MGKPSNVTSLAVALVGAGLFMFGCGPEAPDTCQMAYGTLQSCQLQAPDGFLHRCYSRPAKFQEILTTPCDVLANQTRGTQSWNDEGDGCGFDWTCEGDLICAEDGMDGGECMPPYEEYNPEEEYEEYNPYNPEEEDEDQYLEEETSWEEDEPNVGYCTHDGQTYPPSTVMGTYVCVDGEWVDSSDDSLNYGGCVMDGITYGEGTQIGPYMCVNGEWIDIS